MLKLDSGISYRRDPGGCGGRTKLPAGSGGPFPEGFRRKMALSFSFMRSDMLMLTSGSPNTPSHAACSLPYCIGRRIFLYFLADSASLCYDCINMKMR